MRMMQKSVKAAALVVTAIVMIASAQAQAKRIAPEELARIQAEQARMEAQQTRDGVGQGEMAQVQQQQVPQQQAQPQREMPVDQGLMDLFQPYAAQSQTEASKPHRSVEELAEWLSGVILEALELPADKATQSLEESKPYFTQPAYREFLTFLSEQSYWLFVSQRKYNMTAASVQLPQLLCKQDEAGFYTWIYEVPVIILLEESEATPDKSGKTAREVVNLRIRLVRIPDMKITEKNPHEVLIENWRLQKEGDAVVLNDDERGCMIE